MKSILTFLFLLLIICSYAQETEKITLKPIVVNAMEYKKEEISLGLKKKTNSRFIAKLGLKVAAKIKNHTHKKGKINSITLHLHKTRKEHKLTNLEIRFYTVNPITGLPDKLIAHPKIIYKPKNKHRGKRVIDLENHNIPFPENGVFAAIRWLPDPTIASNESIGPSLRMTVISKEKLTYIQWKNNPWTVHGMRNSRTGRVGNIMISLNVWVRKGNL